MKVKLTVDLLRDNNTTVLGTGQTITKIGSSHTDAKAQVQAELDARIAAAGGALQDLSDANAAFNS